MNANLWRRIGGAPLVVAFHDVGAAAVADTSFDRIFTPSELPVAFEHCASVSRVRAFFVALNQSLRWPYRGISAGGYMDRRNRIQCLLAAALVFLTHPPLVAAFTEAPPQTQVTERIPIREPVRLLKARKPNLPESATTAQYEELSQIENGRVAYEANGVPRRIDGRTSLIFTDTDDESVRAADLQRSLPHLRRMFLAHGTEDLQEVGRRRIYTGGVRITLQESIRGIPVRLGRIELNTEAGRRHVRA